MGKRKQENWGSQLGVILAVAGSAIGLGNFIRFPGQAATYGGGGFMIPYLISFLLIAIPLTWAEWSLGRTGGRRGFNASPGIFGVAAGWSRPWMYVGSIGVFIPMCISMYYLFIESWCLAFAIQYFTGFMADLGIPFPSFLGGMSEAGMHLGSAEAYSEFFTKFVGADAHASLYSAADGSFAISPLLCCTIICVLLNYFLIYLGLSRGIELFCKVAMSLLLVCSLLILIRVLTLPNPTITPENPLGAAGHSYLDGLGFMWNPSREGVTLWGTLSRPDVWLAATAQIFFSVSIGTGAVVTYASYVREKEDIALSGLTATVSNEFCEVVLAGLMILPPAVMFMGISGVENNLGMFSLGFNVLPNVFEQMPFGQFFGFLFFFLLFMAAVTSSLSQVQPPIAMLEQGLNIGRKRSVCLSALLTLPGTIVLCHFSKDMYALDTFDFWVGNFSIFVLVTLEALLIGWFWGTENMLKELSIGAKIRVPRSVGWILKYVSTPYLILIFAFWCWKNASDKLKEVWFNPLAQLVAGFVLFTLLFYIFVTWLAIRRWEREGKLKDVEEAPKALADTSAE